MQAGGQEEEKAAPKELHVSVWLECPAGRPSALVPPVLPQPALALEHLATLGAGQSLGSRHPEVLGADVLPDIVEELVGLPVAGGTQGAVEGSLPAPLPPHPAVHLQTLEVAENQEVYTVTVQCTVYSVQCTVYTLEVQSI